MSFTYATVSLGGEDYPTYGELEAADKYLAAAIAATAWGLADDDTKAKALVSAGRWLDGLSWLGTKADSTQALAWPRSSIANVANDSIPSDVAYAAFEMASALTEEPDLFMSISDPMMRSIGAGSVNASFFRPMAVQWPGQVPKAALAYIAKYLASSGVAGGPTVSGVSDTSPLDEDYSLNRGL